MALLDLLGHRWALRVLWELRAGPLTSRELRTACGELSPTVLQARTHELRAARIVSLSPAEGYALTPIGRELLELLLPLARWADRWAAAK